MLAGLLKPSEGVVRIDGREYGDDPAAVKRILGFVPDTPPLYENLTGRQYVALVASLWGIDKRTRDERTERLFHKLFLSDCADELCRGYSHGTRKKAHIAAVLTTAPNALLLDEPTTGLDPRSARARRKPSVGVVIMTSRMATSTCLVVAMRIASSPFSAVTTSNPSASSVIRLMSSRSTSSSTSNSAAPVATCPEIA